MDKKTIITNANELYDAISTVSRAIDERSPVEILTGLKIDLKSNSILLTGYDLEIGIQTEIAARVNGTGSFIVKAKLLADLVKSMMSETIAIEIIEKNSHRIMRITSSVTEVSIPCMDAVEYPTIPTIDNANTTNISQAILKNMISRTVFAVSDSLTDNRPVLRGELFDFKNDSLTIVALDGFRIAIRKERISSSIDGNIIVPGKSLVEIARLLKDDEDLACSLSFDEKSIMFSVSGYTVYSRLIEGKFYDYTRFITPNNSPCVVSLDKQTLIASLERASILVDQKTKTPIKCIFDSASSNLKVHCTSSIGKVSDKISIDIEKCNNLTIGFNHKFLLQALKAIDDEKITINMIDSFSPARIGSIDSNGYTYIVLPVRLKN